MKKGVLDTTVVTQVGILVHDIQITDPIDRSHATYRGVPTTARAKLAFFKVGPSLELELIQPDSQPSTCDRFD